MTSAPPLPNMPEIGVTFLESPVAEEAMILAREHCDDFIYNHAARCAYWAIIISQKLSEFASPSVDLELVIIICVLHDMGLASNKGDALPGLSLDKRFEVDGANIAKDFISSRPSAGEVWDAARLEKLWTAIALHSTPSIALHAAPEVALANMAITADFAGPYWSPDGSQGPITVQEYRAVTKRFPRGTFSREGLKRTICGLCQRKPKTTYDNIAGSFGRSFGYDGQGLGQKEYAQNWEENQVAGILLRGLDALDQLDANSGD